MKTRTSFQRIRLVHHVLPLAVLLGAAALGGCSNNEAQAKPATKASPTVVKDCGKKGQPDCPLQAWMKGTLRSHFNSGNTERLAVAYDELAAHAPDGFSGWAESAAAGAEAARGGDMVAAKAACKSCHDQHRGRYRKEMRGLELF
jgi:hypothetical protein